MHSNFGVFGCGLIPSKDYPLPVNLPFRLHPSDKQLEELLARVKAQDAELQDEDDDLQDKDEVLPNVGPGKALSPTEIPPNTRSNTNFNFFFRFSDHLSSKKGAPTHEN